MDVYMNDELKKSGTLPLHTAADAVMGEEGGWEVPVSYGDAAGEAKMVRSRAGIFDVSHLGRIRIRGNGALDLLERVCTSDVAHQEDDAAAHTLLCNERGGIIDECFLLRLAKFWVLTTNAANRQKVIEHLESQEIDDVKIDDQTEKVYQFAVAGPKAKEILRAVLPISIDDLADGGAKMGSLMIANYIATRVSYSGEWTLEVMVPGMFAGKAWGFITRKAGDNVVGPAGMAARDILRIEAGRPRYGHETNEMIDLRFAEQPHFDRERTKRAVAMTLLSVHLVGVLGGEDPLGRSEFAEAAVLAVHHVQGGSNLVSVNYTLLDQILSKDLDAHANS